MAWLRAAGGGNTEKDKKLWIIKNGEMQNGFTITGSGLSLDTTNNRLKIVRTSNYNGGQIINNNHIKFSDYSTAYMEYMDTTSERQTMVQLDSIGLKDSNTTVNVRTTFSQDISNVNDYPNIYAVVYGNVSTSYIYNLWLEPTDYLYKDGVQSVAWDNVGYSMGTDVTSDGGATLNSNNFEIINPTTDKHSRCIVTNNAIDMSQYSKLKYIYTCNSTEHTDVIDVSSYDGNYFVSIGLLRYSGGSTYSTMVVSTIKNESLSNRVALSETSTGSYPIYVSKVWLEK